MAQFTVRVSDDVMARFDAVAAPLGGRSARIRKLITEAAGAAPAGASSMPRTVRSAKVWVQLDPIDLSSLGAEAASMGLTRASWLAALIRRRVRGVPTFSRPEEPSLIGIHMELRRIGVNITQTVRALNTAATEGELSEPGLSTLVALRQEMRGQMQALRRAFEGNLAYWEIAE